MDLPCQTLVVQADFDGNNGYSRKKLLSGLFASAILTYMQDFDLLDVEEEEAEELYEEDEFAGEVEFNLIRYYLEDGEHYIDILQKDDMHPLGDYDTFVIYGKINSVLRYNLGYLDVEHMEAIKNTDLMFEDGTVEGLLEVHKDDNLDELFADGVEIDVDLKREEEILAGYKIYYTLKKEPEPKDDEDDGLSITF